MNLFLKKEKTCEENYVIRYDGKACYPNSNSGLTDCIIAGDENHCLKCDLNKSSIVDMKTGTCIIKDKNKSYLNRGIYSIGDDLYYITYCDSNNFILIDDFSCVIKCPENTYIFDKKETKYALFGFYYRRYLDNKKFIDVNECLVSLRKVRIEIFSQTIINVFLHVKFR